MAMTTDEEPVPLRPGNPYQEGGGGEIFEHQLGAFLLTRLLRGIPLAQLGHDFRPEVISFQASASSPLDDFEITGRASVDDRVMHVGVRRHPNLVPSREVSVKLVRQFIDTVRAHREDFRSDRRRLWLVVATHDEQARQVADLAEIARGPIGDYDRFAAEVARERRTNEDVRNRLGQVLALVEKALGDEVHTADAKAITLQILRSLYVSQIRLEPPDAHDIAESIGHLQSEVRSGTPEAASALFDRLSALSDGYARGSVQVDWQRLRRDLHGLTVLSHGGRHPQAWEYLDDAQARLRTRTSRDLTSGTETLRILREDQRRALREVLEAATPGSCLLVSGEPGVGKSALVLDALDEIPADEVARVAISLQLIGANPIEIETRMDTSIDSAIAEMPVAETSLFVIDGAEVVLHGRGEVLLRFVEAAFAAGSSVVVVARNDAVPLLESLLSDAVGSSADLRGHLIPGLTVPEVDEIADRFPQLAAAARDPVNGWLFSRPGLVKLLLPGRSSSRLPEGALTEVDVFEAVWGGLVRNNGSVESGVYPQQREEALVARARRLFEATPPPQTVDAAADASLRSEGLLLPWGPDIAWGDVDDFASDLVRDFATTQLLLTDGFGALHSGDDRRWALRAAILASQVRFAHAPGGDTERVRAELHDAFDRTAAAFGDRWKDVPLEAMITSRNAREMCARAWVALRTEGRTAHLIRIANQRYTLGSGAHEHVLTPLVSAVLDHVQLDALQRDEFTHLDEVHEAARELVFLWLFGLLDAQSPSSPERQRLQRLLMAEEGLATSEDLLELLALLGDDLDADAVAVLERVATDEPKLLQHIVDRRWSTDSMMRNTSAIFERLALAYFVARPGPLHSHHNEYGIRDHELISPHRRPMTGWDRGPFWTMLTIDPDVALRVIGQLVDRATAVEVESYGAPLLEVPIELPGVGIKTFLGSEASWRWYRGGGGPWPVVSALLALELWADHLIELGETPADVVEVLARSSESLATLGLVMGFLERHVYMLATELSPFLELPVIWQLESIRVAAEFGGPHMQQRDAEQIHNPEIRRWRVHEICKLLFAEALAASDDARIASLTRAGEELRRRGEEDLSIDHDALLSWVGHLAPAAYTIAEVDGQAVARFEPPSELMDVVGPGLEEIGRAQEASRIGIRYSGVETSVENFPTVLEDARVIRALATDPPALAAVAPTEGAVGVAATLVEAVLLHGLVATAEEIEWATRCVVEGITAPLTSRYGFGRITSAARAVPLLLLDLPPGHAWPDRDQVAALLITCCTAPYDDIREAVLRGLRHVASSPCDGTESQQCRHVVALDAIEQAVCECRLGGFDQAQQRRVVLPLEGPLLAELAAVGAEDLLIDVLLRPIVVAAWLSAQDICCQAEAASLRDELLSAYRRGYFAEKPYAHHQNPENRRPHLPGALFSCAAAGNDEPLVDHITEIAQRSEHLQATCRQMAIFLTYSEEERTARARAWSKAFSRALDIVGERPDLDGIAGLLLYPSPVIGADFGPTLLAARTRWLPPSTFAADIERWIALCAGHGEPVDALVSLAWSCSDEWQGTTGLEWLEAVIGERFDRARTTLLVEWLMELHGRVILEGDHLRRFRRIVDGLVAAGVYALVGIQTAAERRHPES
jgi:hypothetical protein